MPPMPTPGSAAKPPNDTGKAAKSKSERDRAKAKKIDEWVSKTSLDDVIFNETEWLQVGRDAEQKTRLHSINGSSTSQLRVATLKKFCIHHRISGYKGKTKHVLCELIVNAVESKRLDALIHPEYFASSMPEETNSEEKMTLSPPFVKRERSHDEEPMRRAAQRTEAAEGPEGEPGEISEEAFTKIMMEDLFTFCHKYGITTSNYH